MLLQHTDGTDALLIRATVNLQQSAVFLAGSASQGLVRIQQPMGRVERRLPVRQNVNLAVRRGAGEAGADGLPLHATADVT